MLLTTLCTEILPILLIKPTAKKSGVYAVFSKDHPGMLCISTDGKFHPEAASVFFADGQFCYASTLPSYACYLDKEFVGSQYSPTALLSAGFLSHEQFKVIAKAVTQSQADLKQAELAPDFDYLGYALAYYQGSAPSLPARLPATEVTVDEVTTVDIEAQ